MYQQTGICNRLRR